MKILYTMIVGTLFLFCVFAVLISIGFGCMWIADWLESATGIKYLFHAIIGSVMLGLACYAMGEGIVAWRESEGDAEEQD